MVNDIHVWAKYKNNHESNQQDATIFFFFHWSYSPLWALAWRKILLHFCLSITNSLRLFTPSTWRSLSTSSLYPFLGLPLRLVPSSSWVKIFLGILSSSVMQLYRLIYYSKSALHVSGNFFAHHQEHLSVFTVSVNVHQCRCRHQPAATLVNINRSCKYR